MAEAFFESVAIMFQWQHLLLLIGGTLLGLVFGIIPGLSGAVAIAMLVPITYRMDIHAAMILLTSILSASAFGGSVTAILINIPGTSVNAATCYDGYPLARQGKAGYAIGASATACCLGACVGYALLAFSIPVMRAVVLAFGPPELFLLIIMGIVMIAVAIEGSTLRTLLSGALGLLLSFHGYVTVSGGARYTFGSTYLWDGIRLTPVFIGLWAVAGAIELMLQGGVVAQERASVKGGVLQGCLEVFRHWWLFLRCSVIGIVIGIIPGIGGAVSNFVAYAHAVQTSRHPEAFGKGNIEGVIAPETANDSKDGGALITTLALGIPGSAVMAILLGAFILHGIQPGVDLLTNHLSVVWIIILTMTLGDILTSAIGLVGANMLAKLTSIKVSLFLPSIVAVSLIAAYGENRNISDVFLALLFGVLGYVLRKVGFSRVALVMGLMLGKMAEETFFQTAQIGRGEFTAFVTRPQSLILIALTIALFVYTYRPRKAFPKPG